MGSLVQAVPTIRMIVHEPTQTDCVALVLSATVLVLDGCSSHLQCRCLIGPILVVADRCIGSLHETTSTSTVRPHGRTHQVRVRKRDSAETTHCTKVPDRPFLSCVASIFALGRYGRYGSAPSDSLKASRQRFRNSNKLSGVNRLAARCRNFWSSFCDDRR